MLRILFPERSVLYSEQYLEVIIDCILSPVDTETDERANEYKSVCRRKKWFAPQSVTGEIWHPFYPDSGGSSG